MFERLESKQDDALNYMIGCWGHDLVFNKKILPQPMPWDIQQLPLHGFLCLCRNLYIRNTSGGCSALNPSR
jgi:hypothetical protein